MGVFKRLLRRVGLCRPSIRLVCVGLDNSGKSTIVRWLKPKKTNASLDEGTPTVGYEQEGFSRDGITFQVYDMGGQSKYRTLWEHFYKNVQGVIFVFDSSDDIRFCVVQDEIETLLQHPDIRNRPIPLLFFANKMDLPDAVQMVDCVDRLDLKSIRNRNWHIVSSNALTGEGLEDGIKWLSGQLSIDHS